MKMLQQHEALEMLVLDQMRKIRILDHLIFGGGTMLRLCFDLPRYSTDFDFYLAKNRRFFLPWVGRLTEAFKGAALAKELEGQVIFDLSGVERITSFGVREWLQMMQAAEPDLLGGDEGGPALPDEGRLHDMMRDPRYWRDRDPAFIGRVTAGFRRLFPD